MTSPTKPPIKVVEYHRLSAEVFATIVDQMPKCIVTDDTTAHRAGFLLGIQYALAVIKKGAVIE